jgi:hypothetical protein
MTWYFMSELGILEQIYISKLDIAAVLLAALAHDVLHPGTNNHFQVSSKSAVALLYGDVSVLENQSSTFARELIQRLDLLRHLDLDDQSPLEIRTERMNNTIHDCILKTDMCHHFDLLDIVTFMAHRISSPKSLSHSSMSNKDGSSRPSRTSVTRASMVERGVLMLLPKRFPSNNSMSNHSIGNSIALNISMASLPAINLQDTDSRQDLLNVVLHAAGLLCN